MKYPSTQRWPTGLRVPNVCVAPECTQPRVLMDLAYCRHHYKRHIRGEPLAAEDRKGRTAKGSTRYKDKRHDADGARRVALLGSTTHYMVYDEADCDLIRRVKRWRVEHDSWTSYAVAERTDGSIDRFISAHSLIMGTPTAPGLTIDHIDGNGLNNRRSNLRWATPSEQNSNRRRPQRRTRSSRYKGVRRDDDRWLAWFIDAEDRTWTLGYFDDEYGAAWQVDLAYIVEFWPEVPRLNVITPDRFRDFCNGAP